MIRCSSIRDIWHKPIMWAKMVRFLRTADSDRTAGWCCRYLQGPWTLRVGDCYYGNCTHQCHQEGTWRPVRRGTGCGANGDESMDLIQGNRPAWLRLGKRIFNFSGTQVCPSVLLFEIVFKKLLYFNIPRNERSPLVTSCVSCGCILLLTIKTFYTMVNKYYTV
jgi:hypothetical protein